MNQSVCASLSQCVKSVLGGSAHFLNILSQLPFQSYAVLHPNYSGQGRRVVSKDWQYGRV